MKKIKLKEKLVISAILGLSLSSAILQGCSNSVNDVEKTTVQETTVEETLSDDEIKEKLDTIYSEIDSANDLCNGVVAIVSEYWDYNGFESFVDEDAFEENDRRNNPNHNYEEGSFYGDAKAGWDARKRIESLMDKAKTELKEIKPSENVEGYYNAIKELYLNVDSYRSFATGFPEGYSHITFIQAFSDHQKEYDELVSKVDFEK